MLGKTCWHFDYHGITCDEYDAMQARAGECCEICGISGGDTPRGSLVIDHFSSPSRRASFVRGLLCDKCNNGVMACLDGLRPWGANRRWQAKAREYEANSWQRPSELALIELSLRVEISHHALAGHVSMASRYMSAAKNDPRYRAALEAARAADPAKQVRPSVVRVRLDRGEKAIAAQLQRHLTAAECKQLGKLLSQTARERKMTTMPGTCPDCGEPAGRTDDGWDHADYRDGAKCRSRMLVREAGRNGPRIAGATEAARS